jgi:hypothetical protein
MKKSTVTARYFFFTNHAAFFIKQLFIVIYRFAVHKTAG